MGNPIQSAIKARNDDMMAAFKARDTKALAEIYSTDGRFMLPNAPAMVGREAIAATFGGMYEAGLQELKLSSLTVQDFSDYILELGEYSLHVEGGVQADKGHYQVLWRNEGGTWMIYQDIVTSSEPLAQG